MNKENRTWKYLFYDKRYIINDIGEILSLHWSGTDSIKNITPSITKDGYYKVSLTHNGKLKTFLVHQLVAQTFISNPKNYKIINHKDGNKLNNSVENLEWCTQKENVRHAVKHGLCNTRKVAQYDLYGNYISDFKSITDASKKTNINKTSIGKVCRLEEKTAGGYIWKYID